MPWRCAVAAAIGLAIISPAPAWAASDHLQKLDGHLQDLASGSAPAGRGAVREAPVPVRDGRVAVDVYAEGDLDAAARSLRALGMRVLAIGRRAPQRMVEGELPVSALVPAERLGRTKAIVAILGSGTNAGAVQSEGDAAHRGPAARALGPAGAGVTVGIVSDSINRVGGGVAASQASGDLPPDVQVLNDGDPGATDEGRAMAEIVYDEAPAIPRILFSTGFGGPAARAQGIDAMIARGATVIADDTVQLTEPFFQDGIVAQAADRARAAGVTYLVSAGNRARQSWEGTYAPVPDPRGVSPDTNDFDPSPAVDPVQAIGTFSDESLFVSLQWDEPWSAAQSDLAIDVYVISGPTPTYQFTVDSDNLASRLPSEFASIGVTGTATVGIAIRRVAGTGPLFMKYIAGGPTFDIEHAVPGVGAIDPDASASRGALTVGAVDQADPGLDTAEAFSSRGPAFRLFNAAGNRLPAPDVRPKPEIAGADNVNTTVPGFQPFFGTSAAAPSVAGIAALVRSAKPTLPGEGVRAILQDPRHNIDCTSAALVPDDDCGSGFVLADGAVRQALDASPPTLAVALDPPAPTGAGGFYTGPVAVSWNAADPESPVFARTGCDPLTVTTDAIATFTCTATSAGGGVTQSVQVKRDASPPSKPRFRGIKRGQIPKRKLPRKASRIKCRAGDPTSGVVRCRVRGFKRTRGRHRLIATAVNGAGLRSRSRLTYRVTGPIPRLTRASARGRTVRFRLSLRARVSFSVARCARKRCTALGRFSHQGEAGPNTAVLPARLRGKRLGRGTYRVTLRARTRTGARSKARTVTVRIR